MASSKDIARSLEREIEKIANRENNVYFFVADTKGVPSGSLYYIYGIAVRLKEAGYNVKMLHVEKDFVSPASWLGETIDVSSLPHYNIETDNVPISASDILFIEEIYASVMAQTTKLTCKRVVIIQNFTYLAEAFQPGMTPLSYRIRDCVTTSESMKRRILSVFPDLNVSVVYPFINGSEDGSDHGKHRKLYVNVIAKDSTDAHRVIKPFLWKYPFYKWVTFRYLSGIEHEEYMSMLADSFATVWIDPVTDFGYSAVEAIKSGSIVIGKVPESLPDWMCDEEGHLNDAGLWFYDMEDGYEMLAGAIDSYLHDTVPNKFYESMDKVCGKYGKEAFEQGVKDSIEDGIIAGRMEELRKVIAIAKEHETEEEKEKGQE